MKYRRLGTTGVRVSEIALGSWLTYGHAVDQHATESCVRTAFDMGINFVDTANVYALGKCETALGQALCDIPRDSYVLASKVYFPMGDGPNDHGLGRKHVVESLHHSLRRLRTEYLDLFQCHRFDEETPIPEVVRTMDDLIRQGKIFYWGVSMWPAECIAEAVSVARDIGAEPPVTNQPCYNMLEREIEEDVLPVCRNHGIGQIVYSPLCQGLLTGKYKKGVIPANSRAADRDSNQFILGRMHQDNLDRVERVSSIAADAGIPMAQLALGWTLRDPGVSSAIIGATRPEQIVENAAAVDVELSEEIIAAIDRALI